MIPALLSIAIVAILLIVFLLFVFSEKDTPRFPPKPEAVIKQIDVQELVDPRLMKLLNIMDENGLIQNQDLYQRETYLIDGLSDAKIKVGIDRVYNTYKPSISVNGTSMWALYGNSSQTVQNYIGRRIEIAIDKAIRAKQAADVESSKQNALKALEKIGIYTNLKDSE